MLNPPHTHGANCKLYSDDMSLCSHCMLPPWSCKGSTPRGLCCLFSSPRVQPQWRVINEDQAQVTSGGEIAVIIWRTLGHRQLQMCVARRLFGTPHPLSCQKQPCVWTPNLPPVWNITQQPESTWMCLVHLHVLTAQKRNNQALIPVVCIHTCFTAAVGSEHTSVQLLLIPWEAVKR